MPRRTLSTQGTVAQGPQGVGAVLACSLAALLCLMSSATWSEERHVSLTIAQIVDALESHVSSIDTLAFTRDTTVVNQLMNGGPSQTTHQLTSVKIDEGDDSIEINYLDPPLGIRHGEHEGSEEALPADGRSGMSLWVLRPRESLGAYDVAVKSDSGSKVIVLRGSPKKTGSVARGFHWEMSVDAVRVEILSVTFFSESGQVRSVATFDHYATFAAGAVLLPTSMHATDFSLENTLTLADVFTDVAITTRGMAGLR